MQSESLQKGEKLNRWRYLRILGFFLSMALSVLWWEIVLRRVFGEEYVAQGREERLRHHARRFRRLAVRMGGVMIKLGQFLSARVDVMPAVITEELAGLQDEVPPEDIHAIRSVVEAELGVPLESLFEDFEAECRTAASLGQVHRARLRNGERVAVKVLRPGIERIVATDLAVLRIVARWLMLWPLVSKRANVPALLEEFAATLWEELDYEAEASHIETFHALFEDDLGVYIPEVYREYSTRRVLTMEDVTCIKISDHAAIDAAGVDRRVVAQRLADVYLRMFFDFGFFHADPHPGNLFIYPLPEGAARQMYGSHVPHRGRPFYIVFVDFGMVGRITPEMRAGLRELLLAAGTRDGPRILRAYQMLGVILPSADLAPVEKATDEVLDYIWGKTPSELARMSRAEMRGLAHQYRDLFFDLPVQVPQNFIYLGRAAGILSGLCTALDPDFNVWDVAARYARRWLTQESGLRMRDLARIAFRWAWGLIRRSPDGDGDSQPSSGEALSADDTLRVERPLAE